MRVWMNMEMMKHGGKILAGLIGAVGFLASIIALDEYVFTRNRIKISYLTYQDVVFRANLWGLKLSDERFARSTIVRETVIIIHNSGNSIMKSEDLRPRRAIEIDVPGQILDTRVDSDFGVQNAVLGRDTNRLLVRFDTFDPRATIRVKVLHDRASDYEKVRMRARDALGREAAVYEDGQRWWLMPVNLVAAFLLGLSSSLALVWLLTKFMPLRNYSSVISIGDVMTLSIVAIPIGMMLLGVSGLGKAMEDALREALLIPVTSDMFDNYRRPH